MMIIMIMIINIIFVSICDSRVAGKKWDLRYLKVSSREILIQ